MKHRLMGALVAAALVVGGALGVAGMGLATQNATPCQFEEALDCTYADLHQIELALYQPGIPQAEVVPTTPVEEVPELGDLVKDAQDVVTTWKGAGWLASLIALVAFLVKLTKYSFVGAWIKRKKLPWIRPLLAMALAALGSAVIGLAAGMSVPWIVLTAVMAGLAAPGAHEFLEALSAVISSKQRAKLEAKADA